MHIIKDGKIVEDRWRHLDDDESPDQHPITVSAVRWLTEREPLLKHGTPVGVRLTASDRPEDLKDDLPHLSLVVLQFASLRDGRSFSHARMLRERLGFQGEIRVRGEYIRDQMFFLSRLGVNAFEFTDETSLADALPALNDFSMAYQPADGDDLRQVSKVGPTTRPRYAVR